MKKFMTGFPLWEELEGCVVDALRYRPGMVYKAQIDTALEMWNRADRWLMVLGEMALAEGLTISRRHWETRHRIRVIKTTLYAVLGEL